MLTDAQVRKIKPLDKKKRYSDEKGLYLEVTPSGGKFWRLKYRFNGRESTLTIGSYPEISLAQARRARDEARIQLYNNIDPNAKLCKTSTANIYIDCPFSKNLHKLHNIVYWQ